MSVKGLFCQQNLAQRERPSGHLRAAANEERILCGVTPRGRFLLIEKSGNLYHQVGPIVGVGETGIRMIGVGGGEGVHEHMRRAECRRRLPGDDVEQLMRGVTVFTVGTVGEDDLVPGQLEDV